MRKTGGSGDRRIEKALVVCFLCLFSLSIPPSLRSSTLQCADGTPPPCAAPANRAPRTANPPLDERTWLILPFENTAGAADAELVRQASVNLLYQELSRWSDLRVISDDRVADLLRDVPAAAQARWGLTTSLGIARRAGAGKLILGDYLAIGGSAQVAAKVYDVRTGRLVRTVRDRLAGLRSEQGLDSLSATFGRLARAALAVPVPAGSRNSNVGTTSLAAYAEYTTGIAQYRAGFADSALPRFQRALQLDSAFALPAMRLMELDAPQAGRFLEIAARSAERLPPRDRLLLGGYRAVVAGQWDQLCEAAGLLLARDSADAEAWFMEGACEEDNLIVNGPDGPRFQRSINKALAHYARALELDPGLPIVLTRLLANLDAINTIRTGCPIRGRSCPEGRAVTFGYTIRNDTVAFVPNMTPQSARTAAGFALYLWRSEKARWFMARFVAGNPRSWIGHAFYARTLLRLGDLAGAEREYDAAAYASQLPGDRRLYYRDRIELELRRERPAAARAYLDSMLVDSTAAQQPQYATVFGLYSRDLNVSPDSIRAAVNAARGAWTPVFAGVPLPGIDSLEARYERVIWPRTRAVAAGLRRLSTIAAFHWRRTGPGLDTAEAEHPLVRFQGFFARGDTVRARALLTGITTETLALPPLAPDFGEWIIGAESWLELGDSARALALMQDWVRRYPSFHLNIGNLLNQPTGLTSSSRLIPRGWLLFADLSLAASRSADARRGYRMVLGLWEGGEATVQPTVARVRAALAGLGN